jgi:hypothetical protein
MSDADLERKLRVNCEPLIGAGNCRMLLDAVWQFDRADTIAPLLKLLVTDSGAGGPSPRGSSRR